MGALCSLVAHWLLTASGNRLLCDFWKMFSQHSMTSHKQTSTSHHVSDSASLDPLIRSLFFKGSLLYPDGNVWSLWQIFKYWPFWQIFWHVFVSIKGNTTELHMSQWACQQPHVNTNPTDAMLVCRSRDEVRKCECCFSAVSEWYNIIKSSYHIVQLVHYGRGMVQY